MRRRTALLGIALIGLAGCGGTTSDGDQITSVVRGYEAALLDGNGSGLCSLLTPRARRSLAALAASAPAPRSGAKTTGCVAFAELVSQAIARDHEARMNIELARPLAPRVAGKRATVVVQQAEGAKELTLEKTQRGWKISLPSPATATSFDLRGGPATVPVQPPQPVAAAGGDRLARFERGRTVVAQSGCLACHRIGQAGNAGPGPDLTRIGATRSPAAIERAILHPSAPMPAFTGLPKAKLRALVTFLSLLRT